MNLESISQDIKSLDKALKTIEKTANYMHFDKARLMFALCTEINRLREKADRQNEILNQLQNNLI